MTDKKTPEEIEAEKARAAEEKAAADKAAADKAAADEKAKPSGRASTKKLKAYVHVDGEVYGPDDKVPTSVAEKITNPKAWA